MAAVSSESVEYRTLLRLTADIELAVKDHLFEIGGKLVASELLTPSQYKEIRNTHNSVDLRAADLVGYVQTKVEQNSQHYHAFVDVLGRDLAQYNDILKKLKAMYNSLVGVGDGGHGGQCPPAGSSQSAQSVNAAPGSVPGATAGGRSTRGMLQYINSVWQQTSPYTFG